LPEEALAALCSLPAPLLARTHLTDIDEMSSRYINAGKMVILTAVSLTTPTSLQRINGMAQCPACRQQFSCGASQHASQPCWCSRVPSLAGASLTAAGCYCPDCLQRLLRHEQKQKQEPAAGKTSP
jgi:hypothetical protein